MNDGHLAPCREVWAALSEPYAPDTTLQRMLLHDVHPRLAPNLLSVAGIWQGFDSAWLSAAILQRESVQHWPAWRMRAYPRQQWRLLPPQLLALRAQRRARRYPVLFSHSAHDRRCTSKPWGTAPIWS
ncbi:hypothetical protein ACFOPN_03190 [Xanthomonas hyacinthi]|uniref:DUF7079 family protein n=1 Tax=Xanthomonas hyacinthi TaxID=56455 RepID=UPI00069DEFAA|nr:hypothetical protein [Xanthomonas hyacinthi]